MRLIAKLPTLAALAHRTSRGLPLVYPKNALGFTERFMYMLFSMPSEPYAFDAGRTAIARALEKLMILHLDHEQNASTSTVRTAGSSQANPFACIAAGEESKGERGGGGGSTKATCHLRRYTPLSLSRTNPPPSPLLSGISSLWGPAHGGANEAVLDMLTAIGSPAGIGAAIARAKDRGDPFRLQGFGHRVYKTLDPRARVMKAVAHDLLAVLGRTGDPLLATATALEAAVVDDPYFVERGLYPNVDFYSGIVLRAAGIPKNMFTAVFAVARSVGWCAQWREMAAEGPVPRIARPRQVYTGRFSGDAAARFVPEAERAGGGGAAGEAARRADGAERARLDKGLSMRVDTALHR